MRDLIGVCESCTTRRTYNAFFNWLHPDVLSMLPQVMLAVFFTVVIEVSNVWAVLDVVGRPAACYDCARHFEAAV